MPTFSELFDKQFETTKSLGNYQIAIGVFDSKSKKRKGEGLKNSELMFIHENGSVSRNIPPRSVLRFTIDYAKDKAIPEAIDEIVEHVYSDGWTTSDIEKRLKRLCIELQNYAHNLIEEDKLGYPLKHRKGIPLLDTGQLMRSIQCVLLKDGKMIS